MTGFKVLLPEGAHLVPGLGCMVVLFGQRDVVKNFYSRYSQLTYIDVVMSFRWGGHSIVSRWIQFFLFITFYYSNDFYFS